MLINPNSYEPRVKGLLPCWSILGAYWHHSRSKSPPVVLDVNPPWNLLVPNTTSSTWQLVEDWKHCIATVHGCPWCIPRSMVLSGEDHNGWHMAQRIPIYGVAQTELVLESLSCKQKYNIVLQYSSTNYHWTRNNQDMLDMLYDSLAFTCQSARLETGRPTFWASSGSLHTGWRLSLWFKWGREFKKTSRDSHWFLEILGHGSNVRWYLLSSSTIFYLAHTCNINQ